MERKTFEYKSKKNGAAYMFAERNRADVSFARLQNNLRGERVKFIQENIQGEEQQRVLLMMEMNKVYNIVELESYIDNNIAEVKKVCFDSFKINNDQPFDEFEKLFDNNEFFQLREMILELEYSAYYSDDEVRQALAMNDKQFKKFKNEQPALYAYAKKHIKKKLQK